MADSAPPAKPGGSFPTWKLAVEGQIADHPGIDLPLVAWGCGIRPPKDGLS